MNKTSLLLIVDAQPGFVELVPVSVLESISAELKAAAENRLPIVFLEMQGYEPTLSGLLQASMGAELAIRVSHECSDGSVELLSACEREGLSFASIRICGLFAGGCVFDTAAGLSQATEVPIEIVLPACDPVTDSERVNFQRLARVELLETVSRFQSQF